jgi:flagellar hook-length control protein FliK
MNAVTIASDAVSAAPPAPPPADAPAQEEGANLSFLEALDRSTTAQEQEKHPGETPLAQVAWEEGPPDVDENSEAVSADGTEVPMEPPQDGEAALGVPQTEQVSGPPEPAQDAPAADGAPVPPEQVAETRAAAEAEAAPPDQQRLAASERTEAEPGGNQRSAPPSPGDVRAQTANNPAGFDEQPQNQSGARSEGNRSEFLRQGPRDGTAETEPQRIEPQRIEAQPPSITATARETAATSASLRAVPELPVQNESRILSQVRVLIQDDGGTARIQIEPPQLGGLNLRVTVSQDAVQLSMVADRAAVADLLKHHLPELRQMLESQGLHVDRVDVDVRDREGSHEFPPRASVSDDRGDRSRSHGGGGHDDDWSAMETGNARPGLELDGLGAVSVHV